MAVFNVRSSSAYLFIFVIFVAGISRPAAAQPDTSPPLLRVVTNDSKIFVGQVINNGETSVKFYDLVSNTTIEIQKSDVKEVVPSLTFDDAVKSIGLPRLLSWKVGLLAKSLDGVGKVARVTPQVIYVTLGKKQGVKEGSELTVFRNKGEIKDPETGDVLAVERPLISQLEVVEVHDTYSKARISSKLEIPIEVADEVELSEGLVVAVCPIRNDDGELTNVGSSLSEEITTGLVQAGIKVVERSALDTVLPELLVQNTVLFEPSSAQKLGELTGANYVVTGKIVVRRNVGTAFVRLINVQSGEIALATSQSVSMVNASTVKPNSSSSKNPAPSSNGGSGSRGSEKLGESRVLPKFLTTTSRFMRTPDKGIRIQGYDEFSLRDQGAIRTKAFDFLTKDFTFEVLVRFSPGDFVANVGLGPGLADQSYNGLKDSVYLRLHAPDMRDIMGGSEVKLNRFRLGEETIGKITGPGPHLVRIIKEGSAVTFQVDSGNDGPTDDDMETTVINIKEFAPFFHSKNMPLFFGGSGEFLSVSLK